MKLVNTAQMKMQMYTHGFTVKKLAQKLFLNRNTLSNKLNNYSPLTADEMFKIADILGIKDNELRKYFYTEGVKNHE